MKEVEFDNAAVDDIDPLLLAFEQANGLVGSEASSLSRDSDYTGIR